MKKYVAIIAVGVLFLMGSTLPCFADAGVTIQLETTVIGGNSGSSSGGSYGISWYTPPISSSTPPYLTPVPIVPSVPVPSATPPPVVPQPVVVPPIPSVVPPIVEPPPLVLYPEPRKSTFNPLIIIGTLILVVTGIIYRKQIYAYFMR